MVKRYIQDAREDGVDRKSCKGGATNLSLSVLLRDVDCCFRWSDGDGDGITRERFLVAVREGCASLVAAIWPWREREREGGRDTTTITSAKF